MLLARFRRLLYGTAILLSQVAISQPGPNELYFFNSKADSRINTFNLNSLQNNYLKFSPADSAYAFAGGMVLASDGKYYGLIADGNNSLENGAIYSYDPVSKKLEYVYYGFNNTNGYSPVYDLTAIGDEVYGFCTGGAQGFGCFFSYNVKTNTYSKLLELNSSSWGASPFGNVVPNKDTTALYFTLRTGTGNVSSNNVNGSIIKYDLQTKTASVAHRFYGNAGTRRPQYDMHLVNDSILLGQLEYSNVPANGGLFKFNINTNSVKYILFNGTNAPKYTSSSLTYYDGLYYGLTSSGGEYNKGTLYSFDFDTENINTVYSFNNPGDTSASNPFRNILLMPDSSLLVTVNYGSYPATSGKDRTNFFSFDLKNSKITIYSPFNERVNPYNPVLLPNGKVLGTSRFGGFRNNAMVFEFDPKDQNLSREFLLTNTPDGFSILSDLFEIDSSKLIMVAEEGLPDGRGGLIVYDLLTQSFSHQVYNIKGVFENNEGGPLIRHSNGKFYRIVHDAGLLPLEISGGILEFDPVSYTAQIVFSYSDTSVIGYHSYNTTYGTNLTEINDGYLLGISDDENPNGHQVVYRINTSNWTSDSLTFWNDQFSGYGNIEALYDGKNQVYFCTDDGGPSGEGIFSVMNLNTNTITVLSDFNGFNTDGVSNMWFNKDSSVLYLSREFGGTDNNNAVLFAWNIASKTLTLISEPSAGNELEFNARPLVFNNDSMLFLAQGISSSGIHKYNFADSTWSWLYEFPDYPFNYYSNMVQSCVYFQNQAKLSYKNLGNGEIEVNVSNYRDNLEYSWDNQAYSTSNILKVPYGIHELKVKNSQGCEVVQEQLIINSVEDISYQTIELSIYPNPAKDNVQLSLSGNSVIKEFTVWNMQGKTIYQSEKYQNSLEVSGWQAGVYIVQCTNENGTISVGKFVIR